MTTTVTTTKDADNVRGFWGRLLEALKHLAQHGPGAIRAAAKRVLTAHRTCMRDNHNYRQAVLTGTTALVAAMALDPTVAAMVTAVVGVYVATFQDSDDKAPFGSWRHEDPYRSW